MKTTLLRKACFAVAIVFSLALIAVGCDSTNTTGEGTQPLKTYKIGLNNLFKGGYPLDIIEASAKDAVTVAGSEFFSVNDEGKVDKVPQDIQSLIASGSDGVMIFCVIENLFPVVAQNCVDGKTPFVFYDKIPAEAATRTALMDNEYFVGGVGSQNYQAGEAIGKKAIADGCKTAIIIAAQQGDPTHEPRIKGFTDVFEASGGKVVGVSKGGTGIADYATKTDDLLTANPDVDCIYGSGGDFAQGGILGLQNHSEIDAKVYATDLDPTLMEKLKSGDLAAANGGHFVNGMFTACLMINYLDGHPILDADGNAPIFENLPLVVLPAEWADLYERFWMKQQPYSAEEIKKLLWRFNKDVDYDYFNEMIGKYSIEERLNAKLAEGAVTEAELKAAGVPIS